MRRGERGSALLAVLILVAMVGALAALTFERFRDATRFAVEAMAEEQARAYLLSAEAVAVARIDALNGRATGRTTLAGNWNGRPRHLTLPHGRAVVTVSDGGNCFNLNSVVSGSTETGYVRRPEGIAQFGALMRMLGVRPRDAADVAEALADWIDSDQSGIEDRAYKGYLPANRLVADVAELRDVSSVSPEIYARLRPWICALPEAELSPVNLNTLLPPQVPLLAMMTGDVADARMLIASRPAGGWTELPAGAPPQAGLATRWFRLDLEVEIAGVPLHERALIDAGISPARLVLRSWGEQDR